MRVLLALAFALTAGACSGPPAAQPSDGGVTSCTAANNYCELVDAGADAGVSDSGPHISLGALGTFTVLLPPVGALQLVDQGLEYTPTSCAGNLCVSGGIVP